MEGVWASPSQDMGTGAQDRISEILKIVKGIKWEVTELRGRVGSLESTVGCRFEKVDTVLSNRIQNVEKLIDLWGYIGLLASVLSVSGEPLLFVTISRFCSWLKIRFT